MSECNCKNILNLQPQCNPVVNMEPQSGSPIIMDTAYHNRLLNRELTDQHPISAITDLQESLETLQNGIEAEEARAKAAEESLSDDIQAENTRAINAEEALQDNIDAEEERAIRAEQAEANTRSNAISRVEGYISDEITARENADTTLQVNINTEKTARENSDTTLQENIDAEALARQNADTTLQSNIDAEALTRENADTALNTKIDNHIADKENPHQVTKAQVGLGNVDNTADIDKPISTAVSAEFDAVEAKIADINSKIPNAASSTNQLADKEFVNSSIATNTANFIGTFNSVAELEAYSGTLTNNDYAFVVGTDSVGNTVYDRYKYTDATTPASWIFEYELNNSSFTAAQWNAINSGATTELVNQITTNQGNITTIQTTIGGYGNIVTHNVSEFATAAQGTKADTAVQPADLATVATSGSYNDLDDKPTIGNATLTIQKNGTAVDTFTANATSDKSINITVPTDTSDLTNGAGYQTASDVQTAIAGKQDTLVSGTNIKTINSNSILGSGNLNIDVLPSQTGQNGKFLSTDGTNPSWKNVDALPSQTGQSGKYLTTDGTNPSWNTITIPSVDVDSISINRNTSDELQTIGVINQNDTTIAIKTWTGTKAQYDAIVTKDANTEYFCTDTDELYLGTVKIGDADLNNKANINLDNSTVITNCITEIPQDIKLELNNGTLTLKAGSKVYVPNGKNADGSNRFDVVTIESDISLTQSWGSSQTFLLFYDTNGSRLRIYDTGRCYSGTTSVSDGAYYNTNDNKLYVYDGGSLNFTASLPIAIITGQSPTISSIDQVFNGFGYIGSTAFALPGVKGLIPNGRNADGSLRNIEFTVNKVITRTITWNNAAGQELFIGKYNLNEDLQFISTGKIGQYYIQDAEPAKVQYVIWYKPSENKVYRCDKDSNGNIIWKDNFPCYIGQWSTSATSPYPITELTTKPPFRAVDWSDLPTITYWE